MTISALLHRSAFVLSGIFSITATSAQPLDEIMARALEGSQALAADRAALEAQREATQQARSSALPSVSVSSFATANSVEYDPGLDGNQFFESLGFADFNTTGLDPARNSNGIGLSARQTLFAGGRVRHGINAAKASVRAAEAGFQAGVEDIVFDIISAYYDVVRAEAQSDALGQSVVTLGEQEQAVKRSFELGRATRTDVASVEAQRASIEAQYTSARAQANSARLTFEALTGLGLSSFQLSPSLPEYTDDVDELIAIARASNGNLKASKAVVEASDAQVRVARGQSLPAVELAGNLSYAEGNLIEGDSIETASVQIQLTTPLFAGGRIASEVRQAKAELRRDRFAQADLNRRLEAAIRSAYGECIAATMSRRSADQQLTAQEMAFEGVTIEAELGQRTTLDVLDAEADLLASRFSAVDAQIREHLMTYNLLRLTGTLAATFPAN